MAYEDFEYLTQITASDKVFCNAAFNIAKNPKYDKYQIGISSMVYKLFAKTSSGNGIRNENMLNQQLAGELNKQITRKFEK